MSRKTDRELEMEDAIICGECKEVVNLYSGWCMFCGKCVGCCKNNGVHDKVIQKGRG